MGSAWKNARYPNLNINPVSATLFLIVAKMSLSTKAFNVILV